MKGSVPVTLGLIGFGAMARDIAACFPSGAIDWRVLRRGNATSDLPKGVHAVDTLGALIASHPRLVVEAAGHDAVRTCLPPLLAAGIPVVMASVGALADPATFAAIDSARRAARVPLVLPSGAVGGLDYLAAIGRLPDAEIAYTVRKPPAAFSSDLAAQAIEAGEAITLFQGTAQEAARLYPKNLNVAFSIALAAHPSPVTVRVVADPAATGNQHEIAVSSTVGTATFTLCNRPAPTNPQTSAVTAMSMAAAIRRVLQEREIDP